MDTFPVPFSTIVLTTVVPSEHERLYEEVSFSLSQIGDRHAAITEEESIVTRVRFTEPKIYPLKLYLI